MSGGRVAVCAVAQHKNEPDIWYKRHQGILLDVLEDIKEQTGVTFDEETGINTIVSCSDDVFDARTISDCGPGDALGAQYKCEEKIAQEGLNALGYAMSIIMSGHDDLVLVMAHCKESQSESRNMCTNLGFDPFFGRSVGLDYLNASALQARQYMNKSGITERQLAKVVVRARQCSARNPFANARELVDLGQVMASRSLCSPIRELHAYPVSDGAVAMLLASEERAHEFTDRPVWIKGFGNCMDSYFLGDRDLTSNFALKNAASELQPGRNPGPPREPPLAHPPAPSSTTHLGDSSIPREQICPEPSSPGSHNSIQKWSRRYAQYAGDVPSRGVLAPGHPRHPAHEPMFP